MTREEFIKEVAQTFAHCTEIMKARNADYAPEHDAFHSFKRPPWLGISIEQCILDHIVNKVERIALAYENDKFRFPQNFDSVDDLINYLCILRIYIRNHPPEKYNPEERDKFKKEPAPGSYVEVSIKK